MAVWPRWVRGRCWRVRSSLGVRLAFLWFTVDLPEDPPSCSRRVVAEDGGAGGPVPGGQRFIVPLDEVNPVVVDALLSAEDRRFYEHGGVDPIGDQPRARQQPPAARAPRAVRRSPSSW